MGLRVIDGGEPPELGTAEYIWSDSQGNFHTKTRVIPVFHGPEGAEPKIEPWTTQGAIISPCYYIPNPYLPQPAYLVLCEVCDADNKPVSYNTRASLRALLHKEGGRTLSEWGFCQQYGTDEGLSGWKAAQDHLLRCVDASIRIVSSIPSPNSGSSYSHRVSSSRIRISLGASP